MITEIFDRFKRVIQTLAPPIQAGWNPPASTEEIIAAQDKPGDRTAWGHSTFEEYHGHPRDIR